MGYYATQTFSELICQPIIGKGMPLSVSFVPSQTIARGTVLGQVTASGLFKPYAHANGDGSQVPKAIAIYDMYVDAYGNVSLASQAGGGPFGETFLQLPVWIKGQFALGDLTYSGSTTANIVSDQPAWRITDSYTAALTGGILDVN